MSKQVINNVRGGADFGFKATEATTVPAEATVDLQDINFSLKTAMGGTLAGAIPTGDGSCPTGTTFIETVNLPNAGGQMDVCQLQRRYDGGDF